MKKKIYNKIYLLPLLLIAFIAITACSQEEIPNADNDHDQYFMFNMKIGDFHSFSSTETRAIGTPDPGKTKWEVDDKIFAKITLHREFRNSEILHVEYLTYTFDGDAWNCTFGNEKVPFVKDNLDNIIPFKHTAFNGYYNPAYDWVFNSESHEYELSSTGNSTEAVNEAFMSKVVEKNIHKDESIDFKLDFQKQMTPRKYSRIRVVAAPNVAVSLMGEDLQPPWHIALGINHTLDNNYVARTVTDSNGNAFFYCKWNEPTPLTIETSDVTTGKQIKNKVFPTYMSSIDGVSYEIDMR